MKNKMTKLEIIDDIVEYYEENPEDKRCAVEFDGGSACVYWNGETGCAVGRSLKPEFRDKILDDSFVSSDSDLGEYTIADFSSDDPNTFDLYGLIVFYEGLQGVDEAGIDDLLQPRYRGHEFGFWKDMQQLHDDSENWARKGGLTEEGKELVSRFKKTWA